MGNQFNHGKEEGRGDGKELVNRKQTKSPPYHSHCPGRR